MRKFTTEESIEYDASRGELQVLQDGAIREAIHIRAAVMEFALRAAVIEELRRLGYTVTGP